MKSVTVLESIVGFKNLNLFFIDIYDEMNILNEKRLTEKSNWIGYNLHEIILNRIGIFFFRKCICGKKNFRSN